MSSIEIEKTLYRIIQGRLRYKVHDDLVLYIHEPTPELIFESHAIYEEAYDQAYKKGIYVKSEILPILLENDYWSPLDDKEAERLSKEIENKKLECFQNFVHKKQLAKLKRELNHLQSRWMKALTKKNSLDHLTCSGVASYAKAMWMISKTAKLSDGSYYDFKDVSLPQLVNFYNESRPDEGILRKIARSEPWTGMWHGGKGTEIFGVPFTRIDWYQSRLCSYSRMYDNVNQHPESPSDKIIEDDECLDGWFIYQKRKQEKEKKQSEIDGMISNSKIRNSDEIYIMAKDKDDAAQIQNINDPTARNVARERERKIDQLGEEEQLRESDLPDQKRRIQQERNKMFVDSRKGR